MTEAKLLRSARHLFEDVTKPAYRAWLRNPDTLWLAYTAVHFTAVLIDWSFYDQQAIRDLKEFKNNRFADCNELQKLELLDNSTKHRLLTRPVRAAHQLDQIAKHSETVDDMFDIDEVSDFDRGLFVWAVNVETKERWSPSITLDAAHAYWEAFLPRTLS